MPEQTYGFVPFDLSGFNFQVTQGEKLAIVLHVVRDQLGDVTYQWDGSNNSPYPDGASYERTIGNTDWVADTINFSDLGFRTWVDAPAQAPPVVTLPDGPAHFVAGDPPVVLSPNATVTDPDSPDFATGTLTVSFVTNGTVDDLLGSATRARPAARSGCCRATSSRSAGRRLGPSPPGTMASR